MNYQIKPNTKASIKFSSDPDSPENWLECDYMEKPGTLDAEKEIISVKKHGAVGDSKRFEKGAKHNVKLMIDPGNRTHKVLNALKKKSFGGDTMTAADNAGTTEIDITGSASINKFDTEKFDLKFTYLNNDSLEDVDYLGLNFWFQQKYTIKDGDNVAEGYALEFESSADMTFSTKDRVKT